jgi:phosphatidylserine synthase
MVSTIKFRSFKTFDLQARRSYTVLLVIALLIAFVSAHPALALVTLSYGYMSSAFVELIMARWHHGKTDVQAAAANVYAIRSEERKAKSE